MPPGYKPSLAAKVFHVYLKDQLAGYFMIANGCRLPVKENFESNTNILHFLSNGISPEGIAILFVQLKSFFDGLRHFNAKFVGSFKILWIPRLYEQDNPVPLFENMRNPPVES